MERSEKKNEPSTSAFDIVSELVPGFHGEGMVSRDAGFNELREALVEYFRRVQLEKVDNVSELPDDIYGIAERAAKTTIFHAKGEQFLRKHPRT